MRHKILLVEDDPAIAQMIVFTLETAGFSVVVAETASVALQQIADNQPDLMLLDWMLPTTSGIQLAKRLRKAPLTADIPLILLTARAAEDDKIQGLEACDDYITKPFSPRELVARIKALLRRQGQATTILTAQQLQINTDMQEVRSANQLIALAPTEYRLLVFFMSHAERVYSRTQLLDHVWGSTVYIEDRTVDVHIRRLRRALAPFGHDTMIQTVRSSGYRFSIA